MNERAAAYIRRYATIQIINGQEELMLPLDKLQGFLDLITPGDVPPELLQKLYHYQAQAVPSIRQQLREQGIDPDALGGKERTAP